MSTHLLTEELLKSHPRPNSGQVLLWDSLVTGFGVRLTKNSAAFVVQWKTSSGQKPRHGLKRRWPSCAVRDARDLARLKLSKAIASREHGSDVPLRLAVRTWCERQKEMAGWRPRYSAKVDSIVRIYIEGIRSPRVNLTPNALRAIEHLGNQPVAGVTRSDVLAVVDAVKPGAGCETMAILSSFFNFAFEREWVLGNPARNRLKVTGGRRIRHRTPSEEEFQRLWNAFMAEGGNDAAAFAVLAFTGCRRKEATEMRLQELNLKASIWTLPAERRKTGRKDPEPFVIHLHPYIVDLLGRQPQLEGSSYVFWGRRDKKPFDFQNAVMKRVRETSAVPDIRLHDIRRFVRSNMGRLGVSQAVAEMCLGHMAKGGLVKVYDSHQYLDEKRDAWLKWGDHLEKLIRG